MQEVDGKKYYTWDEIIAMPLGTKFKFPWFSDKTGCKRYMKIIRDERGAVLIVDDGGNTLQSTCEIPILQDRFELYEDKPQREYVTGCQALEKLINGEWKKIACERNDWSYKYVCINHETGIFNDSQTCFVDREISPTFLKLKKWYEYKG